MMKTIVSTVTLLVLIVCSYSQWQSYSIGIPSNSSINCFYIKSNRLYTGTTTGLYYSTNEGNTWNAINNGLPTNGYINTVTSLDSVLYVGIQNASTANGLYRSTNNGEGWILANNGIPPSSEIYKLVSIGQDIYVVGSSFKVYKTTNNGENWIAANNGLSGIVRTLSGSSNGYLYAGTSGNYVYVSANNGLTWTQSIISGGSYVNSLAYNSTTLYMSGYSVNKTTNNGINWINCNLNYYSVAIITNGENEVFMGASQSSANGFYMSTNSGINWILKNEGLSSPSILSLIVFNNYIFAGTTSSGVYRRLLTNILNISTFTNEIPSVYGLYQNYPNPFNPKTDILFDLPKESFVKLIVYDALGKEVSILANQNLKAGSYKIDWDATNYPSGIYFYKIEAGDFSSTKKMILIK